MRCGAGLALAAVLALPPARARAAAACCSIYDVQPDKGLSVLGTQLGVDAIGASVTSMGIRARGT